MKHADNIRAEIISDTKKFLQCLDADASVDELTAILIRIREKESQLIKAEGAMLAPDLWKLLHKRLIGRINRDLPEEPLPQLNS